MPPRRTFTVDDLRKALVESPADELQLERAHVRVAVANFLQELRTGAGLTQLQVAERAGMTQSEVSRLERAAGPRAPELATLVRASRACGFDLDLLASPRPPRKRRSRKSVRLTYT